MVPARPGDTVSCGNCGHLVGTYARPGDENTIPYVAAHTMGEDFRARFTYDDIPYATDPTTVTDIAAGDWIHVEGQFIGQPVAYDAEVLAVGEDEFGRYFTTEFDDHVSGYRWGHIANTVIDRITRADRTAADDSHDTDGM